MPLGLRRPHYPPPPLLLPISLDATVPSPWLSKMVILALAAPATGLTSPETLTLLVLGGLGQVQSAVLCTQDIVA